MPAIERRSPAEACRWLREANRGNCKTHRVAECRGACAHGLKKLGLFPAIFVFDETDTRLRPRRRGDRQAQARGSTPAKPCRARERRLDKGNASLELLAGVLIPTLRDADSSSLATVQRSNAKSLFDFR